MYYIGVDLGGTNIATGIMDKSGQLIGKCSAKTLGDREPELITADIAKTILKVMDDTGISADNVEGIGIGIPGAVNNDAGKVINTNNMNFSGFYLVKEMQKYIDKPIRMANDANSAALGEMIAGGARGYQDVVMITIGTGIGGGFITKGKIYSGFNDAAMEVGHISIDYNGKQCNCGRKGCWEAYASANALIELTKEYMSHYKDSLMHEFLKEGKISGMTAFLAARKGDKAALLVVEQFSIYLSVGIADIINLIQPEVILIGGGISNEGDFLLDRVRDFVRKNTYAYDLIANTQIKKAALGNDAGIIGAGFLMAQ